MALATSARPSLRQRCLALISTTTLTNEQIFRKLQEEGYKKTSTGKELVLQYVHHARHEYKQAKARTKKKPIPATAYSSRATAAPPAVAAGSASMHAALVQAGVPAQQPPTPTDELTFKLSDLREVESLAHKIGLDKLGALVDYLRASLNGAK